MTRTIAVTGSASGIGAATAAALERRGTRVIGVDLRDADVIGDLATPTGRRGVVEEISALAGVGLDGVIACAGVATLQAAQPTVVSVNYFGVVDVVEALRPLLAARPEPAVAVVASVAMLRGASQPLVDACLSGDEERACAIAADGTAAYASSKRALARWVRRRAPTQLWAGAGICLNAVSPGVVRTPMTALELDDDRLRDDLLTQIDQPMGAVGRPEYIAGALAWLTSAENRFTTGQVLYVDGGFEARATGDEVASLPHADARG